jgi:hypothetical protein
MHPCSQRKLWLNRLRRTFGAVGELSAIRTLVFDGDHISAYANTKRFPSFDQAVDHRPSKAAQPAVSLA